MNDVIHQVRSNRKFWFTALAIFFLGISGLAVWIVLPPSPSQLLHQGLVVLRTNPNLSEQLVRQALSGINRSYPDAAITLCRILVRKGALAEAHEEFQKIELGGCRSDYLLAFGRDALAADDREIGYVALEALASRQIPDGLTSLELLLADYQDWGQVEKQVQIARTLVEREPHNSERWSVLVRMLAGMSRDLECVEAIRDAQQHRLPPVIDLEFQNELVQRLINLGDINGVRQELSVLRQREPDSIRVRGHLVYQYRMEGKLDQALDTISKLLDSGPGHPYAYFTRGIIYLDLRRFSEAVDDLKRTLAAQPFNSAAEFKLSEAYRGLGQVELADQHRKSATRIADKKKRISVLLKQRQTDARNPEMYRELSQLSRELGDLESARHWDQWFARMSR